MKSKKCFIKKTTAILLVFCVALVSLLSLNEYTSLSIVASASEENNVVVEGSSMYNKYLKLVTADNSRFVIGTIEGNPSLDTDNDKKLLYGFPDNIGTSYSTIVVDGNVYKYGDEKLINPPTFNVNEKSNTSTQNIGNIEVNQTLSFINNISTNREDVVEIKYVVTNNDTISHTVGTRIMLDTMLGSNDSAPFRVEGVGNVTTETEFVGDNIPQYWQAFDSLTDPQVISQGTFLKGDELKPDKVQFTNWKRVYDTSWNYAINEGSSNGDSAVTITWDEKELAAGESRTYKTYYGLSELTQDLLPPLAISVYGDNTATVTAYDFDKREAIYLPLAITAYLENIGDAEAKNAYIKIELPENMSLTQDSQEKYTYDILNVSDIKQVGWNVKVSGSISKGTYPIKVVCGADGIEEKVVQRYITVPETDVFKADNRIRWGEEKKNLFGEPTGKWTGLDNLGFINRDLDFFAFSELLDENKKTYHISDEYFNKLTKDLKPSVIQNITDKREGKWGGSCYGMSSVVSLMRAGYLTPSKWKEGATIAHDLSYPKESENTENLINFYNLSQLLPDIVDLRDNYKKTSKESDILKQLVLEAQKVKQGGLPVSVSFWWAHKETEKEYSTFKFEDRKELLSKDNNWTDNNGNYFSFSEEELSTLKEGGLFSDDTIEFDDTNTIGTYKIKYEDKGNKLILKNDNKELTLYRYKTSAHAILAYDVDGPNEAENGKNYRYRVSIYDPNKSKWTYLYISEDYKEWYYYPMYTVSGGENNVIKSSDGNEEKFMGLVLSDVSTLNIRNPEDDTDNTVLDNYNKRFIQDHTNSSINISNSSYSSNITGVSVEGNVDFNVIPISGITADGKDSNNERLIFIPDEFSENEPYTIKPTSGLGEINSSLVLSNYLFVAKSTSGKVVNIDPAGKIYLQGNDSDYYLGVTFNNGCNLPWYTIRANGNNATNSSLEVVSDGMILTSDNLNSTSVVANNKNDKVNISFSTDNDSVKLMAINETTLGVYVDADNDGIYETLIADSNSVNDASSDETNNESNSEPSGEENTKPSEEENSKPNEEENSKPIGETNKNISEIKNDILKTGDTFPIIPLVVMCFSATIIVVISILAKKKKN